MATSAGDEQTIQYMLKRWGDPASGLDDAWREDYLVHLSFPDPESPNKVTVGGSPAALRSGHAVSLTPWQKTDSTHCNSLKKIVGTRAMCTENVWKLPLSVLVWTSCMTEIYLIKNKKINEKIRTPP